jgi:hypothetical protein
LPGAASVPVAVFACGRGLACGPVIEVTSPTPHIPVVGRRSSRSLSSGHRLSTLVLTAPDRPAGTLLLRAADRAAVRRAAMGRATRDRAATRIGPSARATRGRAIRGRATSEYVSFAGQVVSLVPVVIVAAPRAASPGGHVVSCGAAAVSGQAVEVVLIVCPQVSHSGQHDDHNQNDHGSKNDQNSLAHRTFQTGMALVRRFLVPRGH